MSIKKILSCRNLVKSYGKKNETTLACNEVSLEAESGGITGILGLNGAGKSTLLKLLSGIIFQDKGDISFSTEKGSVECSPLFLRKNTGFVSELPPEEKNLSVLEVLEQEAELYGKDYSFVKKAISAAGLTGKEKIKSKNLSRGYEQRLNLARAISHDPDILVLDEFSAGLDPSQAVKMREELKKLSKEKIIIVSTHSISEATELCDKIHIMHRGKIVCLGSLSEILEKTSSKNLEEAFLSVTESQGEALEQ